MSNPETGADRLLEIFHELDDHSRVLHLPGSPRPKGKTYHGYGRTLQLPDPDGRTYGAYALGRRNPPVGMDIYFYGESSRNPNTLARLGYIALSPVDGLQIAVRGANESRYRTLQDNDAHTFPPVTELAKLLGGDWLSQAVQCAIDEEQACIAAITDFGNAQKDLSALLGWQLTDLEAKSVLVTKVTAITERAHDAAERHQALRTLWSPSLENTNPLDALLHDPGGASVFMEMSMRDGTFSSPVYLTGPLLGQSQS